MADAGRAQPSAPPQPRAKGPIVWIDRDQKMC
jgi:hypothetical protein